ncbi:hypothetical protein BC832DRAFT_518332, partial [Gaertneriomyces semiglobifer]
SMEALDSSTSKPLVYDHVALGGTFDHLHAGHKILLTAAAWLARTRLVCGVVDFDQESLKRKKEYNYMQPIDDRVAGVKAFLTMICGSLQYEVVPITDAYGPTRYDDLLQAIVGSQETLGGCTAVNKLREENGLNPLDIFTIDVISSGGTTVSDMSLKISSTAIR